MKAKKILIVEDEFLLSHAMKISAIGDIFEVVTASNGKEGLELIQSEKPDLVLLDLIMPEMDGFELMAAIRADDDIKDTKVVILSNETSEKSMKKAKELGAIDYFIKVNADLTEMAKKLEKLLK